MARAPKRPAMRVAETSLHPSPGAPVEHRYAALLGIRTTDPLATHRQVARGLPYAAIEAFQLHTGLSARALAEWTLISDRTLARRREQRRLEPDESDRLVRVSRVFGRALDLFEGNTASARGWLTRKQPGLGGATPLDISRTDVGAREVEDLIGRVEHGISS